MRHGGFIPWDDDVDVMFTRKNYEMFAKVVRRELPEDMSFVEPDEYHGGKAFYDFISRVTYNKSQKFEDSGKMDFYDDKISRLNVDLFIVDGLPEGKLAKKLTKLSHCVLYGFALGHRYEINYSDYRGAMKLFVAVLANVGKLIPFPVIWKMWNGLCHMDSRKQRPLYFYTGYAPNWFYVEMKREWDDEVVEMPFEDTKFYVPSGWKELLTQLYGDYMKLPPALREFYMETGKILKTLPENWDYEFLFVNDGSRDQSLSILKEFAASDEKVKIVNFSRNFGHEAAMIAGLDYAEGDGIVCMDADLQHPPECLPEIVEKFDEGYEVISMVRTKNKTAGFVKNVTSAAFYKLINHLSDVKFEANASDFFAVGKNAAEVLRNNYREKVRFLRGYVQSIGFEKTTIEYEARPRFAGESKYSLKSLFKFSINTILCFSDLPLKLGIYSGVITAIFGLIMVIYTVYTWKMYGAPSGYATIVVLISFMFAVLFVIVGIIGEYIAILFAEIKDRPVYIVKDTENFRKNITKS